MTSAKTTHASHEAGRALEIVTLWGDASSVLSVTHLDPPRDFVVGEGDDPSVDAIVAEGTLSTASFSLVRCEEGRATIVEPSGSTHEVSDDVTAVAIGALVFRIRFVERERAFAHGAIDRAPARYVAATAAVAAIFGVVAALAPADAGALVGDRLDVSQPLVAAMIVAPERVVEPSLATSDTRVSEATAGSDGTAGRPESHASRGRRAGSTRTPGGPAAPVDAGAVPTQGVLGVLRSMLPALTGDGSAYTGDGALGDDPSTVLGLLGDRISESTGTFGIAMRGPGRGTGNDPAGTVDTGGYRTRGDRGGDPYGRVNGLCEGPDCRPPVVPHVTPTHDVETTGSIPREAIQRVVRRHVAEIRFCYEQSLTSRPDLEGRVATSFVIGPTGAVVAAQVTQTSLRDAAAEDCIASAVRRWTFPAPSDGGLVRVTYPFSLTSSN